MSDKPRLDSYLKTRVTEETRAELSKIAAARELGLSDIAREALREKIERHRAQAGRTLPTPTTVEG